MTRIAAFGLHLARAQRLLLCLGLLAYGVALAVYWIPAARHAYSELDSGPDVVANVDFFAYYAAGKAFGLGLDPYVDHSKAYPELRTMQPHGFAGYLYPPFALPFYQVLAQLSYDQARLLWLAGNAALYLAAFGAFVLANDRQLRPALMLWTCLFALLSHPLLLHIRQGQIDLAVFGLVWLSFVCTERGWRWASSFLLALATLVKVYPALLLLYFVFHRRDGRYFATFALASTIAITLSLPWVPPHLYQFYGMHVLPAVSGSLFVATVQSLPKYFTASGGLVRLVQIGCVSLFVEFLWRIRHSMPVLRNGLESHGVSVASFCVFLMNVLVVLLTNGLTWHMAYASLIFPLAGVIIYLQSSSPRWLLGPVFAASALLLAPVGSRPPFHSLNVIGAVLLLVCLGLVLQGPAVRARRWLHAFSRNRVATAAAVAIAVFDLDLQNVLGGRLGARLTHGTEAWLLFAYAAAYWAGLALQRSRYRVWPALPNRPKLAGG